MEIPKFKFFSDPNALTVPFKINQAGLLKWLEELDKTAEYPAGTQLLRILLALNSKKIEPKLRLTLLEDVKMAIIPIIKRLEFPILGAKIPLDTVEQANYELITAIYRALAEGFWRTTEDITALSQQEPHLPVLAKALLEGLEALKRVLLYTSESYEQLYKGYWLECYQFYRRAENYNLLDLKLGDNPEACNFIAASFNSLVVFYLSGPNQYNHKDIKPLYKFFERFAMHALIYKSVAAADLKLFFKFSLDQDAPPGFSNPSNMDDSSLRYLTTVKIAKIAYDNLNRETTPLSDFRLLKPAQFAQVVKSLGMGTHRRFVRVQVKKNYTGIVGYDNILDYLRRSLPGGVKSAVEPFDPRIAGDWKLPDLKLIPLEEDYKKNHDRGWNSLTGRSGDNLSIWASQEANNIDQWYGSDYSGELEIVDSSVKGYGILFKEKNLKVGVGEFIAIIIDDGGKKSRNEIGIVRRIGKAGPMRISLGVELIASEADAVCIYRPGNVLTKSWAVLLRGIKALNQSDSIIYNSHTFGIGEEVCLELKNKTGNCRINKLLHATPTVVHAELLVNK